MTAPHVTIIGAGIVGVSTAAFLQREGCRVTIVDRAAPGEGCSFGNAGGIAFGEILPTIRGNVLHRIPGWLIDPLGPLTIRWSYLPKVLPWLLMAARNTMPGRQAAITAARAQLGLRALSDLETLLDDAHCRDLLVKRETLRLFDTEAQFRAEAQEREIKAAHGFPCDVYSGDEAREMEPALSSHISHAATHGGWYFITNPGRLVKTLADRCARKGATIIADDVRKIETEGGRAISLHMASGDVLAIDKLVICAGAYSHLLAKQLGDNVPLEAERGYHIVLPNPGVSISRPLSCARTPGVATPMEMGLRIAGTDEFAGLAAKPNWARADALWAIYKRVLPQLQAPDASATRWMGHRPGTPDSLPVISQSAGARNVWHGFGHGHMGLTWGATTGRLLAEQICGRASNMDLVPFTVKRFPGAIVPAPNP
jgi:D-amino-acid dehydrogenase